MDLGRFNAAAVMIAAETGCYCSRSSSGCRNSGDSNDLIGGGCYSIVVVVEVVVAVQ